jgi:hypothetical protein
MDTHEHTVIRTLSWPHDADMPPRAKFEHVQDPDAVLRTARNVLDPVTLQSV